MGDKSILYIPGPVL